MTRKAAMILILLAIAASAFAQPAGGDPPSRVARLNYMQGQVSFRPGSVDEWTNATLNYPLYNGDHLWTEMSAGAELHIGSTAIRMGSETALAILNLDDRMVQLSLTGGALSIRLRTLGEGESFEVDTPNSAVTLLRPGEYRFTVDENNAVTVVTVRGGDAEVTGGGRAASVHARETARFTGADDSLSNVIASADPPDGFDRWCLDRDRREDQSESVRYVGRETIGYEDLDANGSWRQVPEYGWVWSPRVVAAGWAPYRFGHWAWVEPWGWTWIDDAPWGFAPFHYGRWAHYGGGWVWVPGAVVARPVYAPALVAFVGGSHFSMAVSFGGGGGVAWFPLGPREVYRPAYHVSDVYVRNVNVTHVNVTNINVTNVNVTNVRYVNQNVQGAVTAVPHATFVGARSVHTAAVAVPASAVAQAQVVGTAAPLAPERASVLGSSAPPGRIAAPPSRMVDRAVVARTAPPPPPVSFAAKRQALEANPGRPVDPTMTESLRRNDRMPPRGPVVRSAMPGSSPQPQQPIAPQRPQPTNQPSTYQQQPNNNQRPQQPQQPVINSTSPAPPQPRNDRPFGRQQQIQQQQPVQSLPGQQQTGQQPSTPPQPPVQRPRFERPAPQQPNQPSQPQEQQQRPRFERPANQPQNPVQPDRPQRVERQESQREQHKQEQQQRKIERHGNDKNDKKEEKKQ